MFIWATEGRGRSVIYIDPDGNRMIRRGGTWAWRNNNPGNIRSGRKATRLGSIGRAGGFAVFPDLMAGRKALKGVLQTSYPNTTLFRLVGYYAPKGENDPKRYRKLLHDFTGLDLRRTVSDLNSQELERLMDAIQRIEGFRRDEEEFLGPTKKIIDVERDKKQRIIAYLVEDLGWLSPVQTIKGILSLEIDGVVAEKGGRTYIRTRPDSIFPNNLEGKGRK